MLRISVLSTGWGEGEDRGYEIQGKENFLEELQSEIKVGGQYVLLSEQ